MAAKIDQNELRRVLAETGPASSDFDLSPERTKDLGRSLRAAGVLVPIKETSSGLRLILTKRASGLKHHPGQISFPGGRVEDTDVSIEAAALREADEEIGLPPASVEVIGSLPNHVTVTNFEMHSFVGLIAPRFEPISDPGEVSEVFEVPLEHVLSTKSFVVQSRRWRGERRYFYTAPYGPYYIWGATARILYGLAERFERG